MGAYRVDDERLGIGYLGHRGRAIDEHRQERAGHGLRFSVLTAERGSAPLQSVFAIALFLVLAMGVIEVALVLYGRNIISASAHEGARAAIELGRNPRDATAIATRTVEESAGGLVEEVDVAVAVEELATRSIVIVEVSGRLDAPGPIPFMPSVSARSTVTKETGVK